MFLFLDERRRFDVGVVSTVSLTLHLSPSFLLQLVSGIFQLHSILLFHLILNMLLRTYGDVCHSFHLHCPMYLVLFLHPRARLLIKTLKCRARYARQLSLVKRLRR